LRKNDYKILFEKLKEGKHIGGMGFDWRLVLK